MYNIHKSVHEYFFFGGGGGGTGGNNTCIWICNESSSGLKSKVKDTKIKKTILFHYIDFIDSDLSLITHLGINLLIGFIASLLGNVLKKRQKVLHIMVK